MTQAVKSQISACIIACDEAENLPDCLASVGFCDEIVLVDSGSSDKTVEIARAAGARVIEQAWLGYAAQRNVALGHASGEWALEIDADERISPRLREEIEAFLIDPPAEVDLCGLPLRELFLGGTLGPSAKYPMYRHRLLRHGRYRHDEDRTVHEGFVPEGTVHPFEGDLIHLLATSGREAFVDMWRYARLEAGQLQAQVSPRSFINGALVRPAVKGCYRLFIFGGWRDGWRGFAKIALDCATDSIVWIRHLFGRRGTERGDSGVDPTQHYGSVWKQPRGTVRVVGVASGRGCTERAIAWLRAARMSGADVALISDVHLQCPGVRIHSLPRLGPLRLIRALDAEEQLRTLDTVVAFGTRARRLLALTPPGLRGHMSQITQETDPRKVNWNRREQQAA